MEQAKEVKRWTFLHFCRFTDRLKTYADVRKKKKLVKLKKKMFIVWGL